MTEANLVQDDCSLDFTPSAAVDSGDVVRLADGRVAIAIGDIAASTLGAAQVEGIFDIAKTASVVMLAGQEAWWDISAGSATHELDGDFRLGIVTEDAAGTDTTVRVDINKRRVCDIDLARPVEWTAENTDGLGVVYNLGLYTLAFDAVAEVGQAALYSKDGIKIAGKPIFEAIFAVFDKGDAAALDIDIGLASASHATDFEAVANFAAFHLDGNSLNLNAHSDDGTTDTVITDTTYDVVDDTYIFVQIDARDSSDVKFYVNGVEKLAATAFPLTAASAALKALVMIEKTSDDTLADVRVKAMRAYRTVNAA